MTASDIPAVVSNPTYLFRCILERLSDAPRVIDMGDGHYVEFVKRTNGQHLALVSNPAHVKRLISIPEAYEAVGIVPQEPAQVQAQAPIGAAPAETPTVAPVVLPEPVVEPDDASTLTPDAARAALVAEDPADETDAEAAITAGSLTIEEARSIYEAELGRRPHPSASLDTLVARINEHRAASKPA